MQQTLLHNKATVSFPSNSRQTNKASSLVTHMTT